MTWTTEQPTKPGFWFYRQKFTRVYFLIIDEHGEMKTEYYQSLEELKGGEWAGPIPLPDEPTEG